MRVDAQVVDRDNRAITSLRQEDFVLREEGKRQEIRNFARENMPVDVLILLDVSASMRPHIQRIANASHQAFTQLGNDDRVAIMVFDRATRVRLQFKSSHTEVEKGLDNLIRQEHFNGGTDITRAMLDAAAYMRREARKDARRAIVIVTDDETEFDRDEEGVERALTRADTVMSALIAPDAMHYRNGGGYPGGNNPTQGGGYPPRRRSGGSLGGIILGGGGYPGGGGGGYPGGGGGGYPGGGGGSYPGGGRMGGPRTRSAGTSEIARASGGDSLPVDDADGLETTLSRIRQRYALHFYLPAGARSGEERQVEVALSEAARRRYPDADVRFRKTYMTPDGAVAASSNGPDAPVVVRAGESAEPATSDSQSDNNGTLKRRRAVNDGGRGPLIGVPMNESPTTAGGTTSETAKPAWRKADDPATEAKGPKDTKDAKDSASDPKDPKDAKDANAPQDNSNKGGWRKVKQPDQQ